MRGKKKKKKTSRFAILQSLVLLCDVLTEAQGSPPVDLDPSQEDHACPKTPATRSHPLPLPSYTQHKGVRGGTRGHCSVFLLYSLIFGGYSNA